MRIQRFLIASVLLSSQSLFADEVFYSYEANAFPSASDGWFTNLGATCTHSLLDGFLVNTWPAAQGTFGGYLRVFGDPSNPPPGPPFWAEWRFASNNAIHGNFINDGVFRVGYINSSIELNMYGDAVISQDGGTYILDLPLNQFRTFRYESPDGLQWCVWVNGKPFQCRPEGQSGPAPSFIILSGSGGSPYSTVNRWDYVRYGRVTTGETIAATDPPSGYLDPTTYSSLDRFTVTFNQPNYVYVNDIVVDVIGNQATRQPGNESVSTDIAPVVIATRRQDNGPPETVEIVLDRPLAVGSTTRFTFNTGAATPQTVEYTVAIDPHPIIPTMSSWGLIILTLLLFIAAKIFRVASATPPRSPRSF